MKKVVVHQSSGPAVGGDISLVHFVNRETVCRESGWVPVTRKGRVREARKKRKPIRTKKGVSSFSLNLPWFQPLGMTKTQDAVKEKVGVPLPSLRLNQSSPFRFLSPADVASPTSLPACSWSKKDAVPPFSPPAQWQIRLKQNHQHNDSCHFP